MINKLALSTVLVLAVFVGISTVNSREFIASLGGFNGVAENISDRLWLPPQHLAKQAVLEGAMPSSMLSHFMLGRFDTGTVVTANISPPPLGGAANLERSMLMAQNLILQADIPSQLGVSNSMISWKVKPLDRQANPYSLVGARTGLNLPIGRYQVTLKIDFYSDSKVVEVTYQQPRYEAFMVDIGRLYASANEVVKWRILAEGSGQVFSVTESKVLDMFIRSGIYRVSADLHGVVRAERVRISRGSHALSELFIPAGRVNLIATRDNAPLFRPTIWQVYRVDNGQRTPIGTYDRHIREVIIPPGHYEAIATSDNVVRSREFWVRNGTTNDIEVPMD